MVQNLPARPTIVSEDVIKKYNKRIPENMVHYGERPDLHHSYRLRKDGGHGTFTEENPE